MGIRFALAESSLGRSCGRRQSCSCCSGSFRKRRGPIGCSQIPCLCVPTCIAWVPPRVQQALIRNGFDSFERICEAVDSMSDDAGAWTEQLGLPPAAEVLLRRFRHATADTQKLQSEQKRAQANQADDTSDAFARVVAEIEAADAPMKRFRLQRQGAAESMARKSVSRSWLTGDDHMCASTDNEGDDEDEDACDGQSSDSEE